MNRPASVAMVSAGFWPALGGAERQALELSAALAARGWRVTVLTRRLPGAPARESVRGVLVLRLCAPGSGAAQSTAFLLSAFAWLLAHRRDFDAAHAHLAGSPALAAAAAARLLGKPAIVKLGGGRGIGELAASSRTALGRLKLAALSALAPRLVAVAADLAEESAGLLGGLPVEVLPNGVDLERFRPAAPGEKASLRAGLGWGAAPAFLYAGRLSPEKRLPWFVRLWLEEVAPGEALLALAGAGPEAAELSALAASSGGRVVLLPAREDAAPLYRACDAFVLPSLSEGLSNALLEAMSSGLPALASRVGGTPEAVAHGRTGLLFEPGDGAGARAALRRLLREPDLREGFGRAGREECRSRFSMAAVAARLEELYRGAPLRPREARG